MKLPLLLFLRVVTVVFKRTKQGHGTKLGQLLERRPKWTTLLATDFNCDVAAKEVKGEREDIRGGHLLKILI